LLVAAVIRSVVSRLRTMLLFHFLNLEDLHEGRHAQLFLSGPIKRNLQAIDSETVCLKIVANYERIVCELERRRVEK